MKYSALLALPCIALISACSSSSPKNEESNANPTPNQQQQPNPTPTPTTTRVLASDAGTMGAINAAGTKLTAQSVMVSGMVLDYSGNSTSSGASTFEISKGAGGEAIMIVDGVTYSFVQEDRDASGNGYDTTSNPNYDKNTSDIIYLTAYDTATLDAALDGSNTNYLQIWEYGVDGPTSTTAKRGFAVVGAQTLFADVASNPTATYSGSAGLKVAPASNYSGTYPNEHFVTGELSMSVDFQNESLSGNIDNLAYTNALITSPANLSGSVSLDPTNIDENGEFTGVVSPDADFQAQFGLDPTDKGSYSGGLFGPDAEQIGGTIGLSSTTITGYGYFTANKD